ncbi:MAG: hypothetical protein L0241_04185 [Planctomycetia bacterium]|nr:hypothetical protein [Planctomycetia bacterium]
MDESQRKKAEEWFNAHIAPTCPSCQKSAPLQIVDRLVMPPLMRGNSVDFGSTLPSVALVCTNCAHVRFFSALLMGILSAANPEPNSEPKLG